MGVKLMVILRDLWIMPMPIKRIIFLPAFNLPDTKIVVVSLAIIEVRESQDFT